MEKPKPASTLPLLRFPRAEAEKKIDAHVVKGERLKQCLQGDVPSAYPEDIQEACWSWHQESQTLLRALFTTSEKADAYRQATAPAYIQGLTLSRTAREEIILGLQFLRALKASLHLYEEELPVQRPPSRSASDPGRREVFVVHGHDEGAREEVARFLERLDLKPIILHEQADRGMTILEKFEAHSDVPFAVVILSPDDECGDTRRARQNVILELGFFLGKLSRPNVRALYKPGVELPSDVHGWLYIEMDSHGAWKTKLAREVQAAGLEVDGRKLLE